MNNDSSIKLDSLTSLRFFAALAVFMHHVSTITLFSDGSLNYIKDFFHEGYVGVTFFFVLSGFIISYSYGNRLAAKKVNAYTFILNRLARIYPVFILTFFIAIAVYYGGEKMKDTLTLHNAIMNIFLLQSWSTSLETVFSFNGVSWSLSVEFVFYTLFLLIFRLKTNKLSIIFLLMTSIILLSFQNEYYKYYDSSEYWFFYINPLFRMNDFIAGVLTHRIYEKIKTVKIRYNQSTATVIEITILIVFSLFILIRNFVPDALRFDIYYVLPISLTILVFSVSNGAISKLLSIKPFVFLGEVSFSFYMIHQIVINYYLIYIPFNMMRVSDFIYSLSLISLVSLLSAITIYLFYEKPLNKYIKKMIQRIQPYKSIVQ